MDDNHARREISVRTYSVIATTKAKKGRGRHLHACFGPFTTRGEAEAWADDHRKAWRAQKVKPIVLEVFRPPFDDAPTSTLREGI